MSEAAVALLVVGQRLAGTVYVRNSSPVGKELRARLETTQ